MKVLIILTLVGVALASHNWCREDRRRRCENSCEHITSERCPRFFFYACPERENDRCICRLYHSSNNRTIRNPVRDCFRDIEMCKDKECPRGFWCREQVQYCDDKDSKCERGSDRRIEAKCVRRTCVGVRCSEGKNCTMFRGRDGERRPRCIATSPRNCDDKICNRNERCEVREGRPHCRAMTEEERCRNVPCREGFRCANGECVRRRCEDIRCDRDYECREVRIRDERINRCVRRITKERRCEDIDCEDGFRCEIREVREDGKRVRRPVCVDRMRREARPPRRMDEIRCREDEERIMCENENRERIARCRRRDDRDDRREREDRRDEREDRENRPTNESRVRRPLSRRPPRDCNETRCWRDERCRIFTFRGMRIASCVSERTPRECRDARCETGEECHIFTSTEVSRHAVCFRNITKELEPRREAERCEELRCEGEFTCYRRRDNGRWRARCRRHESRRRPAQCWNRRDIFRYWRFDYDRREDRCEERVIRSTDAPRPRADREDERREERRPEAIRREEDRREDREREWERRFEERHNRPDRCLEVQCIDGEECVVEFSEDRWWARCVNRDMKNQTERFRRRRRSCEEIECEEGFRCEERREDDGERRIRDVRERREDREFDERRRRDNDNITNSRRREDREREEYRSRDHIRREERRRREDDERRNRRREEDRTCERDDRERSDETDEREDSRCEDKEDERRPEDVRKEERRRRDERRREDIEREERRRRDDRRRRDERRREDRDREEARRREDRERRERISREDRDRRERRRIEWVDRGARCVRDRC